MEDDALVQESGEFRGFMKIACPVYKCLHVEKFALTDRTIDEQGEATRRRREYLRLSHSAGRHTKK
jgi:hypothetical protein